MIVKSPHKKQKIRPNLRKETSKSRSKSISQKNGSNGTGNGTIYGQKKKKENKRFKSFKKIKPWKVITATLLIGAAGLVYLNHVFATQELLQEVQQMEREYNAAKRLHAEYQLTYDRMTGPAEIYSKARELGFVNGGPADQVIEIED